MSGWVVGCFCFLRGFRCPTEGVSCRDSCRAKVPMPCSNFPGPQVKPRLVHAAQSCNIRNTVRHKYHRAQVAQRRDIISASRRVTQQTGGPTADKRKVVIFHCQFFRLSTKQEGKMYGNFCAHYTKQHDVRSCGIYMDLSNTKQAARQVL